VANVLLDRPGSILPYSENIHYPNVQAARLAAVVAFFVLWGFAIAAKLFELQVLRHTEYLRQYNEQVAAASTRSHQPQVNKRGHAHDASPTSLSQRWTGGQAIAARVFIVGGGAVLLVLLCIKLGRLRPAVRQRGLIVISRQTPESSKSKNEFSLSDASHLRAIPMDHVYFWRKKIDNSRLIKKGD
jgi:hypothetical protein